MLRRVVQFAVRVITAAHAWRLFRRWARRSERDYQRMRRDREGFERHVYGWWSEALDWFDVLWLRCYEQGASHNRRQVKGAARDEDAVFEGLRRLHGRACRVASEVAALLRTGHAEGAFARWRTLHEINVTMQFLSEHGDDTATRYLLHTGARRPRLLAEYQRHVEQLEGTPFTAADEAEAESERQALVARYGKGYDAEYGWAVAALGDKRPTFAKIEASLGMDHARPWYRLASEGSHAGARALEHVLPLPNGVEMLLAGPSDGGLYEPGAYTALTLVSAADCFLACRPDVRSVGAMLVLNGIVREVEDAFERCHERLMADHSSRLSGDR